MPLIGALQHEAHYIQGKRAVNTFLLRCSKNVYLFLIYLKTKAWLFFGMSGYLDGEFFPGESEAGRGFPASHVH
jgi:hypothetical protein